MRRGIWVHANRTRKGKHQELTYWLPQDSSGYPLYAAEFESKARRWVSKGTDGHVHVSHLPRGALRVA